MPISGTATMPSHSLMTGVATSSSCSRWRSMSAWPSLSAVCMTTTRRVPISTLSVVTQARTCSAVASSGRSDTSRFSTGGRSAASSLET